MGSPFTSISSSDPTMANGIIACEEKANYISSAIYRRVSMRSWTIAHPEFTVILNSLLVILLDIVREVVDWNVVIFNIFHNSSLEGSKFGRSESV